MPIHLRSNGLHFALLFLGLSAPLCADVRVPAIIGSHMVLQRDMPLPIWGRAEPGEKVTVEIAGQSHETKADREGRWSVKLTPLKVGPPLAMSIAGKNRLEFEDVLVGEVWICSGQSNMQFAVSSSRDGDLELAGAKHSGIRLITVATKGTQTPLEDFDGRWEICSSSTAGSFSAVGYYFGKRIHEVLGVPVGLIDNAWGGSACEAWVRRDLLEGVELYQPLLERWEKIEANFDPEDVKKRFETRLARWKKKRDEAKEAGKPAPRRPRAGRNPLEGQHRPANLYNGRLKPIMPFAIRGAIWYQGEHNASRAYQYRDLFPLMVENWRRDWKQGDFSFYWVQLADFRAEKPEPAESDWAELREAQTLALKRLPNSGQAVIIDLGEGRDIHPRNKQDVAQRLARWALALDYGKTIEYQSPTYKSHETAGGKIVIGFDHVGRGLRTFDRREVVGLAIAGEDRKWVRAQGKVLGKERIEVWSPDVAEPVAVRYGWADNPICNLFSEEGLPATPFRTDDWPGVTAETR